MTDGYRSGNPHCAARSGMGEISEADRARIDDATVRLLEDALTASRIGQGDPDPKEAAVMLIDAAILIVLANHKPLCAVDLAKVLAAYIVEQAQSAVGHQVVRQ